MQKGFTALHIVIVIAVAIAGYLLYFGKINIPQKQVNQTSTTSLIEETANWKTYTNDYYNFTIQYPSDWVAGDDTSNKEAIVPYEARVFFRPESLTPGDPNYGTVTIGIEKSIMNIDDYIKSVCESSNMPKRCAVNNAIAISIGDISAKRMNNISGVISVDQVFIKKGEFIYTFSSESNNKTIFDQILSTFKFN